jgi:hypothetical protein
VSRGGVFAKEGAKTLVWKFSEQEAPTKKPNKHDCDKDPWLRHVVSLPEARFLPATKRESANPASIAEYAIDQRLFLN